MWILSRVNNDDKVYLLRDKPKYTVGRNKTCDIVGEATQSSLGRYHATLHPYEDRVDIIDTESKYGTYINDQISTNEKLIPNTNYSLKDGDTVRFGFIDFTWKLEKNDIVVLTSTLTENEKNNLKKDISVLGGQTLDQWSNTCTHLAVKNLTFTVKVLQSLCHAIPIVKPEYFKEMLSSIRCKRSHPSVDSFQPQILERLVSNNVLLQVNIDRKRLFAGKTFVFMNSRHMETYQGIIECGMGECSSLDKKKWQKRSLVKPGFIVINNTTSSTQSQLATQAVNDLNDFLRSKGNRLIPDSEISLAILHCSLDKFCNPKHTLNDNFRSTLTIVPSTLLANNTPVNQIGADATKPTNSINIPETIEEPNSGASTSTPNVIELMDDDDDIMLVQSLEDTMENTGTGKRKNSSGSEELITKKQCLAKDNESPKKANEDDLLFRIPQRDTRSISKKNVPTVKPTTEEQLETTSNQQHQEDPKPTSARSMRKNASIQPPNQAETPNNTRKTPLPQSNPQEPTASTSTKNSFFEQPKGQKQIDSNNLSTTETQIYPAQRKRIAHRPTIDGDNSDSDDDLFKFNNAPSAKKSKPSKGSDSDSDDNMNYPQSSRPVSPIVVMTIPSQSLSQPSQITADSWLSRPTPSQNLTDGTIRTKPKKRNDVPRKANPVNVSGGWQIGQYSISTKPVRIPTQGWFSKDTIKSKSLESEVKKEETTNDDSSLEDTKWIDSIKRGIQVITKSMTLISMSGKSFKKQQFIAPTEVIKTSKIYEF